MAASPHRPRTVEFMGLGKPVVANDIPEQKANDALAAAGYTPETADAIYTLTSLAKFDDRFAIPAAHREQAIEMLEFTGDRKGSSGFGFKEDTMQRGL